MLKLYLEKRKDLYLEPRLQLAKDQMIAAQKKAKSAAQAVDNFKRNHQAHSLEAQRANLLAARSEIEKQRTTLDNIQLDQKAEYYSSQLSKLDEQEHSFTALLNEAKIADEEYALATHKVSEARAFDDLSRERVGSVRVIQPPTVSPTRLSCKPLSLQRVLSFLFFLFLAQQR